MKAYSVDIRTKIITAYLDCEGSITQLSKRFKVSRDFVFIIIKKFKDTGDLSPGKQGNNRASKLEPFTEFIKSMLSDYPSLTLS
ncbi:MULTISPECIES: IS630 transposase-related protein [unclassified Moorena]|nr:MULTISPECIES: IS630 transposase-related protein [unclassified Moorena]NEO20402.1 hypothetical protein [Moorena sp. SIO4A5]NEQ59938.1 hypothetical protein [Moorena sp. SIO4A1]